MKRRGWAKDPWRPAGVTVFELARVMATSMRMIERHYGAPFDGAPRCHTGRLDALEVAFAADVAITSRRWNMIGTRRAAAGSAPAPQT
jgi:hypothetical protein